MPITRNTGSRATAVGAFSAGSEPATSGANGFVVAGSACALGTPGDSGNTRCTRLCQGRLTGGSAPCTGGL